MCEDRRQRNREFICIGIVRRRSKIKSPETSVNGGVSPERTSGIDFIVGVMRQENRMK